MSNRQKTEKRLQADGLPTLIGSVPAADHDTALEWIFRSTPFIPLWPQLPANPRERMMHQFSEGLPGIVESDERIYFDTATASFEAEQLAFFEDYLRVMEDPALLLDSRFATSRERANGLYLFREAVPDVAEARAVKGQITGPFTLLTGITDLNDRLGFYDPAIREIVVKGLAMKAAWQVRFLREKLDLPVLLFIDEPALAGLGSSTMITISRDEIAVDLAEVIEAVHGAGGLAGVHVCANTDWDLLLRSDIDILSFDAHGYFDRLVTCDEGLHHFLDRGGILAWGIVPTADEEVIRRASPPALAALWQEQAAQLTAVGRDLEAILHQTLITPSCGTGSLTPVTARRVLSMTAEVSKMLRREILGEDGS